MKKLLYIFALITLLAVIFTAGASAAIDITEEEAKVLDEISDPLVCESVGDIDGSGAVTVEDARLALRFAISLDSASALQKERGDVNNDSEIDVTDARGVLRIAIGLDKQSGHETDEIVLVPATCVTDGYSFKYCRICLKKYSEQSGTDKTIHVAMWVNATKATCQNEGLRQYKCQLCGEVLEEKVIEKGAHSYGSWVYPDGKDCLNPVERYRICDLCGYRQEDVLNPVGHHTTFWVHTKEKTCLEDGLDELKCINCGYVEKSTVIEAPGHHVYNAYEAEEYVKATCTQDGLQARLCLYCGAVDESTVETVPARGHIYDFTRYKVVKESTCSEEGTASVPCLVCGEILEFALDKIEHTLTEDWTETIPATCTQDGERKAVCKYCGEVTETVPATGHAGEWTVTKAATCAEEGEEQKVCPTCGYTETKVVEKPDHKFKEPYSTVLREPTCTTRGLAVKRCRVCGFEKEVPLEIVANRHVQSEAMVEISPATCTKNAKQAYVCVECGVTVGSAREIKGTALGHTAGEWQQTAAPTCTQDGAEALLCAVCGEAMETKTIPAAGHTSTKVEITFNADGTAKKTVICEVCGETVEESDFNKLLVKGGKVTFTAESTMAFQPGDTVAFTVETEGFMQVSYSCKGCEEGVVLTAENGVYSFAIPAGLEDADVITIHIETPID